MAAEVYLTRAELAERWKTSPGRLANDASRGRGPRYYRVGSSTCRYRLSDIVAYEESRVITTLDQPA